MHTHARAALAVCLLAVVSAGCQSARMPSFAFWNRSPGDAAIASAAAAANETNRSEAAPGERVQQVSYNRASAENQRRDDIADALSQARSADARGQVEAARAHYQRVLDLEPGHSDALHALGILADKQGDYRTAETHYFRALRAKSDDANLLSDMGYSYFLQGRRHDAEYYLREALKYDPQHAKARGNLELLFNEQHAFETYRQLLGDREATARMHALFPQSGSGVTRTAASAPAPGYGYEDPSRSARNASPAVPTHASQAGSAAWPQQDPRTAYGQMDQSTVDYLRSEMERERHQAASQRERQHETIIAPAAEAFGQSQSGFGAGASPLRTPQSPANGGFETRHPAAFGQPQQFAGSPPQASPSPYGQWVEPPRGGSAVATQAPTSAGSGVEQWPHAPGGAWGAPASQGQPANARPARTAAGNQFFDHMPYPTTSATSAAPQPLARQASRDATTMSDMNRAAQRIGMEGGLFPSGHPSAAPTHASQPAAHGVAPAGAVSTSEGWNGGSPNWNGQAGIRTAEAWQGQPSPYGASSDPRYPQRPGIVITPGASGTAAPSPSASGRPTEHGWNAGPEAPANGYAPEAQGAWPQRSPAAGPHQWPQSGYGAPTAAHPAPARAGDVPSSWQNAPGGTGWNGQ